MVTSMSSRSSDTRESSTTNPCAFVASIAELASVSTTSQAVAEAFIGPRGVAERRLRAFATVQPNRQQRLAAPQSGNNDRGEKGDDDQRRLEERSDSLGRLNVDTNAFRGRANGLVDPGGGRDNPAESFALLMAPGAGLLPTDAPLEERIEQAVPVPRRQGLRRWLRDTRPELLSERRYSRASARCRRVRAVS